MKSRSPFFDLLSGSSQTFRKIGSAPNDHQKVPGAFADLGPLSIFDRASGGTVLIGQQKEPLHLEFLTGGVEDVGLSRVAQSELPVAHNQIVIQDGDRQTGFHGEPVKEVHHRMDLREALFLERFHQRLRGWAPSTRWFVASGPEE